MSDERALSVSCPRCKAGWGVSCSVMTKSVNQRFRKPHRERRRAGK